LDREGIARTLSVNRDIFIRTLALLAAFAWFTAEGARQGDLVLAVNAILQQFVAVSAFFLDGFAFSAEALVGRSIGARHRAEVVLAVRRSTLWAGAIALALTALLAVFGPYAIDALSTDPKVRELGRDYYLWAAAIPFLAVWCYQLDGIFIGATRGATMRNAMLVAFAVYLLLWWLLRPFGNHGLWAAFAGFMVARAVTLGWFYPALVRAVPERADDPALRPAAAD
jgi:MATE family multidrug resistance protein